MVAGGKNKRFHPQVVHWQGAKENSPIQEPYSPQPFPRHERNRRPVEQSTDGEESVYSLEEEEEEEIQWGDGDWKATVITDRALENAHIKMVIYGNKENSSSVVLSNSEHQQMFQDGSHNEFKINLKGIGKITKLRLELQPDFPEVSHQWKPKEIKLQNMKTRELLKFKFNCWLSRSEGNRDIMCELPAIRPGQRVLPVLRYHVEVYTANEPGADTESNVYLTLFGGLGDTGKRLLFKSDRPEKFQEGQVDIFTIEAVSLGSIKRCLIVCDGTGPGEGWKCEKIVVREDIQSTKEFYFPCNMWLEISVGDGKLQRLLKTKREKPNLNNNGQTDFFHRLTGNKPGVVQIVASDDEDSDPGFYKRYISNYKRVQDAIHLGNDEEFVEPGYSAVTLPRIASPTKVQPLGKYGGNISKDVVKFPDIYESSQSNNGKRRPSLKRLNKENKKWQRSKRVQSRDSSDYSEEDEPKPNYPWETNTNRKLRNKALSERKLINKLAKQKPQVDISKILTQNKRSNNDFWSDVEPDENEEIPAYSSKTRHNYLKNRNHNNFNVSNQTFKPISAVYIGTTNKNKQVPKNEEHKIKLPSKHEQSRNTEEPHPKRETPNLKHQSFSKSMLSKPGTDNKFNTPNSVSRNVNHKINYHHSNDASKRDSMKYNPRTKKGEFPWESKTREEKPKTALVRPTQREDLNKSAKARMEKKQDDRSRTFSMSGKRKQKQDNMDSHFPSRVEIRLMARRARLQKNRPQSVKPRKLHPKVSNKLFVGFGQIDERINRRREMQNRMQQPNTHETINKSDHNLPEKLDNLRRPVYKRSSFGPSRTEQRAREKQLRDEQKKREKELLLAQQQQEKKPIKPVYMPPLQREKNKTYGEHYHNVKKSISQNGSKTSTAAQRNINNQSGLRYSSTDHYQKVSNSQQNTNRNTKVCNTPAPIGQEDSEIWDYFASVVDNLKSIEARDPLMNTRQEDPQNDYSYNNDDNMRLPPGIRY